jgi:hypothetical protein
MLLVYQYCGFCIINSLVSELTGLIFMVFSAPWWADIWYLLSWSETDFKEYKKELDGLSKPCKDPHIWEQLFDGLRKTVNYFKKAL